MNECLLRHFKFPNEHAFPCLRGAPIRAGALIKFFSCEEGHSFEGGVHLGRGAYSDNYGSAYTSNCTVMAEYRLNIK